MKIARPLDKGHIAIGTSLLGTAEKASPWRYHRVTSKCKAIFTIYEERNYYLHILYEWFYQIFENKSRSLRINLT